MKLFVRAFALSLVVTGAVASMNTSNVATSTTIVSRSTVMPVPTCPPGDPEGCGIAKLGR